MPSIQPVGASSRINMLLHADIGTGKTTLIGTGGKQFKILIVRPPIDHTDSIIGSGVQETIVRNWEDTHEILEELRHSPEGEWDWVWIDSLSLLQDVGLDDVYEGILDRKGPIGSQARKDREQFGPDKGEYRVNMWRVAQWVRAAVSEGNFNLGITAHSFWFEPEEGDAYLAPWIQGKGMVQRICGMMNIVGYMHLESFEKRGHTGERRVIEWNKSERFYAKNQFKIPPSMESVFPEGRTINPTLPGIVEAINKGRPVTRGTRRQAAATPTRRGKRPVRRS